MSTLFDLLNEPGIRDMLRRYNIDLSAPASTSRQRVLDDARAQNTPPPVPPSLGLPPLPFSIAQRLGDLPTNVLARQLGDFSPAQDTIRIGKDEVAAGERNGSGAVTAPFRPPVPEYPMPPLFRGDGVAQRYGMGGGAIDAAPLPPLSVIGNRVGPSGPPLSTPMVGPEGIGDRASAMYGALPKPPAPRSSFSLLPALFPAMSQAIDEAAMRRSAREADERWGETVAKLGDAGLPPDLIKLAGLLGPGKGRELLGQYALEQSKGQREQPDFVNLHDNESNRTFAASKAMAEAILRGNPTRFSIAGELSSKPDIVTMSNNGRTRTLNLSDPADMAAFNQMKAEGWSESKTPAATINMNNSQESAYAKTMGEGMAKEYLGLMDADRSAVVQSQKIGRLGDLLGSMDTGTFAGTTNAMKAAAKAAGIDLDSLGVTDDVAPAQASKAISNEIALQLRNPAGGAGMPGALSDKDREFLSSMVPSIQNTPEGNKLLLDYWSRVVQRNRDVARIARDYKKRTGRYDEGVYDEFANYANKNPLFGDAPKPSPKGKVVTDLPSDAKLDRDGYYRSPSNPGRRWKAVP